MLITPGSQMFKISISNFYPELPVSIALASEGLPICRLRKRLTFWIDGKKIPIKVDETKKMFIILLERKT